MALPVRKRIGYYEEVQHNGMTVRIPMVRPSRAVYFEDDTIMWSCGYFLHMDDDGYYRSET